MQTLRIPKARVNVFLVENQKVLKELKKFFRAEIELKVSGEIEFSTKDPIDILTLSDVIKAIGRGFDPEIALKLMDESVFLVLIDLNEFARSKKSATRLKGRIIGREGKIKSQIEKEMDVNISIYGKTVAVIGRDENIYIAKKVIETILEGKPYSAAFHHVRFH